MRRSIVMINGAPCAARLGTLRAKVTARADESTSFPRFFFLLLPGNSELRRRLHQLKSNRIFAVRIRRRECGVRQTAIAQEQDFQDCLPKECEKFYFCTTNLGDFCDDDDC